MDFYSNLSPDLNRGISIPYLNLDSILNQKQIEFHSNLNSHQGITVLFAQIYLELNGNFAQIFLSSTLLHTKL